MRTGPAMRLNWIKKIPGSFFNLPNHEVVNLCRGLDPYPGAWFDFEGQQMKVYKCDINEAKLQSGQWSSDYKVNY